MKHIIFFLFASLALANPARADLILEEPFNYPDGPLVPNAGGRWVTHGGTADQIETLSGKAHLTQGETEDVNAGVAGAPYRGVVLYASMTVNFSVLPAGAGNFFAHFKDGTATGFRARIFASTNGVPGGRFRVGIANGAGTPVNIPVDLSLNTDYLLVLRYDTGAATSTLWLAPPSESTLDSRADATDTATALSIASFALRQAGTNPGMGVLSVDQLRVGTSFVDVIDNFNPRLDPPSLSSLPDQRIPANSSTPALPLIISDGQTPAAALVLGAVSDQPTLVPGNGVTFGGSGSNRSVTVFPAPGRQGSALITVTVTDTDGNPARRSFRVTVGAPTLSVPPDQVTPWNQTSAEIPFTVGDGESDPLEVTASSTNPAVLASHNILLSGAGPNRRLTVSPNGGQSGVAGVVLFASDGFNTVSNQFLITIHPTRGVLYSDRFAYPDGPVISNSANAWIIHSLSGAEPGETQVLNGKLYLDKQNQEDIHATLTNAPYAPAQAWVLYSRFEVNFSALPGTTPDYFAHFRNNAASSGARVYATTRGAAPGRFRLGVGGNADQAGLFPVDLQTNVTYTVVTRFNVATGQSRAWLNPSAETDPGVDAGDTLSLITVSTYAFRQSTGIGALWLDNLRVATSFAEVLELEPELELRSNAGGLEISWPASVKGCQLQRSSTVEAGGWTDVPIAPVREADRLVVRGPWNPEREFFRLIQR